MMHAFQKTTQQFGKLGSPSLDGLRCFLFFSKEVLPSFINNGSQKEECSLSEKQATIREISFLLLVDSKCEVLLFASF